MKKTFKILISFLALVLVLVGCSTKENSNKDKKVLKVGAANIQVVTDILEATKEDLAKDGYTLEIVNFSDYKQPNEALKNKEVDANFFQHKPFMEAYNKGTNSNLVQIQKIYDFTGDFYGKDIKDIKDIKEGAEVAVPSDPTNMSRALRLLAKNGVIKLNDNNSFTSTENDIVENPKNIKLVKVSLLNLNEAYNEKDLAFNYPDKISKLGLNPKDNAVIKEEKEDQNYYALSLVSRDDNKMDKGIEALKKALTTEKVKKMIEEKYKGIYSPAF